MLYRYLKIPVQCSFLGLLFLSGCKKLVNVPAPRSYVSSADIFSSDATAASVLTGIYTTLSSQDISYTGPGSLFLFPALSADELTLFDKSNLTLQLYYINQLLSDISSGSDMWTTIYPMIYDANAAISGLTNNTALTPAVRDQLLGEAKFLRAFFYFYLANLYGDAVLATGTDYTVNSKLPRVPKTQVYQQVVSDLKSAESLLSAKYLDASILQPTSERVRPTSWAASALLARTYLYLQKWDSAEVEATKVINNTLFSLDSVKDVFLANSSESIWQLQPVLTNISYNTGEGALFILPDEGPNSSGSYPVYLSSFIISSFEPKDLRRVNWVDSVIAGGVTYYYPYKYKQGLGSVTTTEYSTVLRLAEQYLIRAEARVEQNKLADGRSDLDAIRTRAGLPATTANSQGDFLKAIAQERKVELFTEWGHRWLDLKRTNAVDTVLGAPTNICAAKGGSQWNTNQQLYPIPLTELKSDPNLVQNPGY